MHDPNTEILDPTFTSCNSSDSDLHKQNPPPTDTPQNCTMLVSPLCLSSANNTDSQKTNDKHQSYSTGTPKMAAQYTAANVVSQPKNGYILYDAAATYDPFPDFGLSGQTDDFNQYGRGSAASGSGNIATTNFIYGTHVSTESLYTDGSCQVGMLPPSYFPYANNEWMNLPFDEGHSFLQQNNTDTWHESSQPTYNPNIEKHCSSNQQQDVSLFDGKVESPVDNFDINVSDNKSNEQNSSQPAHPISINWFDKELGANEMLTPAPTPQATSQKLNNDVDFKINNNFDFLTLPCSESSNEKSKYYVPQSTLTPAVTLADMQFDHLPASDDFALPSYDTGYAPFQPDSNTFALSYSEFPVQQTHNTGYPTPPQTLPSTPHFVAAAQPQQNLRNRDKDAFLLKCKEQGLSYKEIKIQGGFEEAESTLRGRYRTLTKPKEQRVRKPEWTKRDVNLLLNIVAPYHKSISSDSLIQLRQSHRHGSRAQQRSVSRIPWKQIADCMAKEHGCYRFGNATVKKKYIEVMEKHGRNIDDLL